jgi:hypothetical protein
MKNSGFIKTPRQARLVEALLNNHEVGVKDISSAIGSLNPPDVVMQLRRQGFGDIIKTRRFEVKDRDGKLCKPGLYYVDPGDRGKLEEALEKYAAQPDQGTKAACHTDNINIPRGGL